MNTQLEYHNNNQNKQEQSYNPQKEDKKRKLISYHTAMLKLKQTVEEIQIMKRRNNYLEVKDRQNRVKANQDEKKIQLYLNIREDLKRDRKIKENIIKLKKKEIQEIKEKNKITKSDNKHKLSSSFDKYYCDRFQMYLTIKHQSSKNQCDIEKFKQISLKEKQQMRKDAVDRQQLSKQKINEFLQKKKKLRKDNKISELQYVLTKTLNKQKQLQILQKIEQKMLQKNSESLKISQTMKNRLREILGSERHLSKFPSMKNSSFTTRYSRRKTSNVLL